MINRLTLILLVCSGFIISCFGQGTESFTNLAASGSTYVNGSYLGDNNVVWYYSSARSVTSDYNISGRSIGLNDNGLSNARAYSGVNGVGRISYKIRSYFTLGTAADRKIEVYVNGSLFDKYTLAAMNTVFERSFTANIDGDVLIEFKSTGTKQIALDDVSWTEYVPTPSIDVSPVSISGFNYEEGRGPSSVKSFTIKGSYLTDDILIKAPTNYEISFNENSNFQDSLVIISTDGTVPSTFIYVRLKSGLPFGNYLGNITIVNPSVSTKNVSLNGNVYILPADVVITEIMYDSPGTDDEWIEICNITASVQNISYHKINVGGSTLFTFPSSSYIQPSECITIALGDNGISPFNPDCSFVPNYGKPTTTNNLSNSSRTIELIATYNSTIVDSVTYSTANGADGNGSTFHVVNAEFNNSSTSFNWKEVPNGGSPGINSLDSPCSFPEIQLKNSSGNLQACGALTLNYESQAIGYTTDKTFEIKNEGTIALEITSFSDLEDFAVISPNTPFIIQPGYSQTVTVRYIPSTVGEKISLLTIYNNDADESRCVVTLKGTGHMPTPEIDIERNTYATIINGSIANTGNNTIFAATIIGTTTAPKIYYIRNEGTANLEVSSIVSSKPIEFKIINNPSPIILAPNEFASFEIEFSPQGTNSRNAEITIINNDRDENPYTFGIKGTGICGSGNITLFPNTGPSGTVVTVAGQNFGPLTRATLNGKTCSVSVVSSTKIEVTIPDDTYTANLYVFDDYGCRSSQVFYVLDQRTTSCQGDNGLTPTDLFISEVTKKGTGSHSYIEIYNGTSKNVNLSEYKVAIHHNGSSLPTTSISLTGNMPNNSVIVIAFGGSNRDDLEGGYTAQFFSSAVGINDDDHIRLNKNGDWIDLWGDITGDSFTILSKDYTYRRKSNGIAAPSINWKPEEWISITPVNYTDIGAFDFSVGIPPKVKLNPIASTSNCELLNILTVEGREGFEGGNPISYQWFYNVPGEKNWVEILPSNPNFSGQRSESLSILNTSDIDDYQFYSQIQENSETCYVASKAVKMVINKTLWNGTSWSDGVPNFGSTAIIAGDYNTTVHGNFSSCKLSVESGYQLIIGDGTYIEITNNVIAKGTDQNKYGKIIVKPKGIFLQVNDMASVTLNGTGKIEVIKETSIMKNWFEYTYWSSPVFGSLIDEALSISSPSRRFYFNAQNYRDSYAETNNNNDRILGQDGIDDNGDVWQYAGGMIMQPGIGYASTNNSASFVGSTSPQRFIYTFKGPFNNGVIKVPIYRNDEELNDINWNFIGNPYPSPIDVDLFLETNSNLDGAIYLWSQGTPPSVTFNGNEQMNFSQDDYAIINSSGEIAGGDGIKPERFIPSGQGFFVSFSDFNDTATRSSNIVQGEVVFRNYMRTKGINDNNQFFRNRKPKNDNKIWLDLTSDNNLFSQLLVAYVDGATNKDDGQRYDAPKNLASRPFSTFYTTIEDAENKKYAIQGKDPNSLHKDEVIRIGFITELTSNTFYKISINNLLGEFMDSNNIYILDAHTASYHNLKNEPYIFTSEKGEFNDRFTIHFESQNNNNLEISTKEQDRLKIIELSNGEVQFSYNTSTISQIEIMDLQGRLIYKLKGRNSIETYMLPAIRNSIFIAKVYLDDGTILVKRGIKRF